MYRQNADVIDGVKWLATLDTRTCLQCAPLDGRIWPPDQMDDVPRPPAHPNCRCAVVPYIDLGPEFEGNRAAEAKDFDLEAKERYNAEQAAKEADGKKPGKPWNELAYETRKKKRYEAIREYEAENGKGSAYRQVKSSTTFAEYFETLDDKSKREWLGASRYNAYQTGALNVDDLINPSDGYVRTVADLKQAGIVSEKTTKRAEMDAGNSGRSDFDPNDYPERDERTWNDPRAAEFIERVRKENRKDAELLKYWTESSGPFNGPARTGNPTSKEAARIDRLVKIIDSYEVPDNARMYRTESPDMLRETAKKGIFFKEGSVVKMEGFTAASATKEAFEKTREYFEKCGENMSVEIEFFVPKGVKAIPLSKASKPIGSSGKLKYEFQKEWLFQKDTEALVLENHRQNGRVYLRLLILNR